MNFGSVKIACVKQHANGVGMRCRYGAVCKNVAHVCWGSPHEQEADSDETKWA